MKLAEITLAKNGLFWTFFTINVGGIGAWFVYFYWYLFIFNVTCVEFDTCTQTTIYWTYKWEKLNKLTLKIEPIIFTTIKLIEKILMQGY